MFIFDLDLIIKGYDVFKFGLRLKILNYEWININKLDFIKKKKILINWIENVYCLVFDLENFKFLDKVKVWKYGIIDIIGFCINLCFIIKKCMFFSYLEDLNIF